MNRGLPSRPQLQAVVSYHAILASQRANSSNTKDGAPARLRWSGRIGKSPTAAIVLPAPGPSENRVRRVSVLGEGIMETFFGSTVPGLPRPTRRTEVLWDDVRVPPRPGVVPFY